MRKITMLLSALVVILTMLVASAPVFAQGEGGCDPQPGQTEKSRSDFSTPPQQHPGAIHSDNPQSAGSTGFGERVEGCA